MQVHEIPRNYKGEGRILYIFSIKALIYTGIGAVVGTLPYIILKMIGLQTAGMWVMIILGAIGFCIATFKIPETKKFSFTEKTGGEAIDDVIKRWIKFKQKKNKIYVYLKEEETKDE